MSSVASDKESLDRELLIPYQYVLLSPGSNVRTTLMHAMNHWLKIGRKQLKVVIEFIDVLQIASLL